MSGSWLDDGSGTISGNGPVVSCSSGAGGGGVYHALWQGDGPVSSGTHYWEVENKGGLGGVGLTTRDKFAKGYACRMFNFNAINLSDGGALLVGGYGPGQFQTGDVVGMLVEMDASLTITFYINGKCYGAAFQVASPYPTDLFPVISFNEGGASAAIRKVPTAPEARTRWVEQLPFPEGDWKATAATAVPVTMHVKQAGEGQYRMSLKVINNCNIPLRHQGGQWQAGPAMMTLMAGPPELMDLEREYSGKLQSLTAITQRGGNLVVSTPSGELEFSPTAPELGIPYTRNALER